MRSANERTAATGAGNSREETQRPGADPPAGTRLLADPEPEVPPSPADACEEAAARLNVVLKMLHADYHSKLRPAEPQGAAGGGTLQVADGLRDIRDLLKAAARQEDHRRAS